MTVSKPQWQEFVRRLEGPKGCNFRLREKGSSAIIWDCSSSHHFELASPILRSMGFDVEKSIAYFRKHGGFCDCEILFNVERSVKRRGLRRVRGVRRNQRG